MSKSLRRRLGRWRVLRRLLRRGHLLEELLHPLFKEYGGMPAFLSVFLPFLVVEGPVPECPEHLVEEGPLPYGVLGILCPEETPYHDLRAPRLLSPLAGELEAYVKIGEDVHVLVHPPLYAELVSLLGFPPAVFGLLYRSEEHTSELQSRLHLGC